MEEEERGRKWRDGEGGEEKEDRVRGRGVGGRALRGGKEAFGKWIIRKAQLKDNLYFINAAKLHYCSHAIILPTLKIETWRVGGWRGEGGCSHSKGWR